MLFNASPHGRNVQRHVFRFKNPTPTHDHVCPGFRGHVDRGRFQSPIHFNVWPNNNKNSQRGAPTTHPKQPTHIHANHTPPKNANNHPLPLSTCFALTVVTLGIISGMKLWPPKPGTTVITNTMSTWSEYLRTVSMGVAGFSANPTRSPACLI
jgi:hypothetical protein